MKNFGQFIENRTQIPWKDFFNKFPKNKIDKLCSYIINELTNDHQRKIEEKRTTNCGTFQQLLNEFYFFEQKIKKLKKENNKLKTKIKHISKHNIIRKRKRNYSEMTKNEQYNTNNLSKKIKLKRQFPQ